MSKCRFLYDNLIGDAEIVAYPAGRGGSLSAAIKDGTGSAVISLYGTFTGTSDLEYIVEIDGAGTGEIGSATFKWTDGSGAWNAQVVATSSSYVTLNNGVQIKWTAGTGADFVLGDTWYFKGINPFNTAKMKDLNRDTRFRSVGVSTNTYLTVDMGVDTEIEAVCLYDHNLTSDAVIYIRGAATDLGTSAWTLSEQIDGNYNSEKMLYYLAAPAAYRYWQLKIWDSGNPDGFIEIGELYLGSYLELSRNMSYGLQHRQEFLYEKNATPYGVRNHRFYNRKTLLEYNFDGLTSADMASLNALVTAIGNRSTGRYKPFIFHEDSASLSDFWLVWLSELPFEFAFTNLYRTTLTLEEVMRSV